MSSLAASSRGWFRLVAPASLFLAAALLRWWAAPAFERMPTDYVSDRSLTAKCRSKQTSTSPVEAYESIVRRHDQTLSSGPGYTIIQGDMHWFTPSGALIFETLNLYGVDRRTRQNLPGYGNAERIGQYFFPPHFERKRYDLWDPLYAGPRVATFDREEVFHGLKVWVYDFLADGIDETSGYASLPEVPERFRVTTYGKGKLWIEPLSGVVVDLEDAGASFLVEPPTGTRVGEAFQQWEARYTQETVKTQLARARWLRWRMLALEVWLPLAFGMAGSFWLVRRFRAKLGGER